ncbi:cell cycle related kinase isoform 1 [Planoprotostelium fungivorum]|uniref:cyclin-dependent kinase n=1 Tax=Planoprotostelium fungivorum TaxID=1890364 RepID=A0A2P6N122_9EUKA|nr:cell cycle related kinase isoform 1 [Planoprotostelium fungivorum]
MKSYQELQKLGEGAFGYVVKARDTTTGEIVALKKVKLRHHNDDFRALDGRGKGEALPLVVLREIKSLQALGNHPHIVKLISAAPGLGGPSLVLTFEYLHTDLGRVLRNRVFHQRLQEPEIKTWMLMLLKGLDYCHQNHIIHRDLKPANLLIHRSGLLKIADFGLARIHNPSVYSGDYTPQVVTRWYKGPELLYGAHRYGFSTDIWSVGCIFGEMFLSTPLFRGESDIDQLHRIIQVLGTPTEDNWPGVSDLPDYHKINFQHTERVPWAKLLPDVPERAVSLLSQLLALDPAKRISADEAMRHPYFFADPPPLPLHLMAKKSLARGVNLSVSEVNVFFHVKALGGRSKAVAFTSTPKEGGPRASLRYIHSKRGCVNGNTLDRIFPSNEGGTRKGPV